MQDYICGRLPRYLIGECSIRRYSPYNRFSHTGIKKSSKAKLTVQRFLQSLSMNERILPLQILSCFEQIIPRNRAEL